MKMKRLYILLVTIGYAVLGYSASDKRTVLWYDEPADATMIDSKDDYQDDMHWLSAFPLGNGSLGAMVFGDVEKERVQLNEESMWSGSMETANSLEASSYLPQIRRQTGTGTFCSVTRRQITVPSGCGCKSPCNIPI